jgi:hypothetical protein
MEIVFLDDLLENGLAKSWNMSVPWFLCTSILYYHWYIPLSVIRDTTFDRMCVGMFEKWDKIEHRHKHLIDPEKSQKSGFYLPFTKLPQIIHGGAKSLAHIYNERNGFREGTSPYERES